MPEQTPSFADTWNGVQMAADRDDGVQHEPQPVWTTDALRADKLAQHERQDLRRRRVKSTFVSSFRLAFRMGPRIALPVLVLVGAGALASCGVVSGSREFVKDPVATFEPSGDPAENFANQVANTGIDAYNSWIGAHKTEIDQSQLKWKNATERTLGPEKEGVYLEGHDVISILVQNGDTIFVSTDGILHHSDVNGTFNQQMQQNADIPLTGTTEGGTMYYFVASGSIGEAGGTIYLAAPPETKPTVVTAIGE